MSQALHAELLKWKRSKMLWLLPIGALLPAFLGFMVEWNRLSIGSIPAVHWEDLLRSIAFMHAVFMSPALFALFAGYVFAREFQEKTAAALLTYARPRWQFAAAKLAVLLAIIAAELALSFAAALAAGLSLRHEPLTAAVLRGYGFAFLLLVPMQFALATAACAIGLVGRSYVPAMGLGIFAVVSSVTVMNSEYLFMYPYSAPLGLLLMWTGDSPYEPVHLAQGIASLLAMLAAPSAFIAVYLRRADQNV